MNSFAALSDNYQVESPVSKETPKNKNIKIFNGPSIKVKKVGNISKISIPGVQRKNINKTPISQTYETNTNKFEDESFPSIGKPKAFKTLTSGSWKRNPIQGIIKNESKTAKVETAKVEPAKVEPVNVEPKKVEPAKVEPAKVEPVKVEPKKLVEPKPVQVKPVKVIEPTRGEFRIMNRKSNHKNVQPKKDEFPSLIRESPVEMPSVNLGIWGGDKTKVMMKKEDLPVEEKEEKNERMSITPTSFRITPEIMEKSNELCKKLENTQSRFASGRYGNLPLYPMKMNDDDDDDNHSHYSEPSPDYISDFEEEDDEESDDDYY